MLAGAEAGRAHPSALRLRRYTGCSRPDRRARRSSRRCAGASARSPSCRSAASARRQLQRQVPRLRAADGDDLRPGGDQGPLHRARPRPAARPQRRARADPRLALAAAARRRRAPGAPQADAAALPRRADALLRADPRRDRRRRDRLLAARRGVRDPPADAGGHPGADPPRRLRRHRGAAAGAAARDAQPGAGGDRLALDAADRARLAPLRRARALGQDSRASCGRSTSCSTRRSPSAAPPAGWRSATTSSRR